MIKIAIGLVLVLGLSGCSVSNVSVNTDFNMLGIQTSKGDSK